MGGSVVKGAGPTEIYTRSLLGALPFGMALPPPPPVRINKSAAAANQPASAFKQNAAQPTAARAVRLLATRLLHPLLQPRQRLRPLVLATPGLQLHRQPLETLLRALVVTRRLRLQFGNQRIGGLLDARGIVRGHVGTSLGTPRDATIRNAQARKRLLT